MPSDLFFFLITAAAVDLLLFLKKGQESANMTLQRCTLPPLLAGCILAARRCPKIMSWSTSFVLFCFPKGAGLINLCHFNERQAVFIINVVFISRFTLCGKGMYATQDGSACKGHKCMDGIAKLC